MPSKSYDNLLISELRDPEFAAGYLTASLEELSIDQFLIALRNVAQARGGLGKLAGTTELNRQNIYRILSNNGNPTLTSLLNILAALGFELSFKPRKINLNPYLFGGRYAGSFVRLSKESVINVSAGGGMAPSFVLPE